MTQPRRKPAPKPDGPVYATVPLSFEGQPIPEGTDLRDVLPAAVVDACVERGEAERK